jgi:ABC-type transporter Mla subunit MlaD
MFPRSTQRRRTQRAFIVRLRREAGAASDSVRACVEDVATRQQHGISSVEDLARFLRAQLDESETLKQ